MPSAIAQSNIFPGAAVAQSADTATLASATLLATHIVTSGAITKGIVSMVNSGSVFLNDWTLATGSPLLTTGSTYYVGAGGKLVKSGGQPIGIATSPTSLSVSIQSNQTASSTSTSLSSLQSQINSLSSQISNLSGSIPKIYLGSVSIANAVNNGSVTGLGIVKFLPTRAVCTVRAPVGGIFISAESVDGTISQDGFDYVLGAITDSANYLLDFVLF